MRMLFVDYSSAFSITIPNILTTKLEHLQGTHISHVTWTHDTNLSHGLSGPHHSVHSHMVSVLRPSSFALPRSLSSNVCLCLVLYIFLWFVYISSVCYLFLHSCCGAPMMSCTTTITAYSIQTQSLQLICSYMICYSDKVLHSFPSLVFPWSDPAQQS